MGTPLEYTYDFAPENAIAFIGTADPWSQVEEVIRISKEQNIPIEVYEDCNHSLETENSLQNIGILKDVIEKTSHFLK